MIKFYIDTSGKHCLRFSTLQCFHYQFFIMIFGFYAFLVVLERLRCQVHMHDQANSDHLFRGVCGVKAVMTEGFWIADLI